jgi:ABC-type sugar transport system permease subunit
MVKALYYSFTDWNGLSNEYNFIGINNYVNLIGDERFINSVFITIKFLVIVVFFVNILAILFAVLLNNSLRKFNNFFKTVFFVPVVISQIAIAFTWRNIYSYNGILNFFLKGVGFENLQMGWLTNTNVVLICVAIVEIWRVMGFHMVIIFASLQTIPNELYEAGKIDGCTPWQEFKSITFPLMMHGVTISIIMSTMGGFKQYALVKVLTDGGPLHSTETIAYNIIDRAYSFSMQGYASAIAIVMLLIIVGITIFQNKFLSSKEYYY